MVDIEVFGHVRPMAAMSRGGKAFVCMTSTFRDKQGNLKSRIQPTFAGDIVTDPRSQAYYLVTEFGIVNLVGKTTWERAEMPEVRPRVTRYVRR